MPNSFIKVDVKLGFQNKLLNSTKHDLGKGNIKLETAREIYMNNRAKFAQDLSDWSALVDFIRRVTTAIALQAGHRDRGTVADVAKVFVLALALSTEGFFTARWLTARRLPFWAKALLYLPIIATVGALTMAVVAAIAAAS
jgi:hypothetical protein